MDRNYFGDYRLSRYLKRRRIEFRSNCGDEDLKVMEEKSTSTDDIPANNVDHDMDANSEIAYPGIKNDEFKAILRMVSNRYDKNSHPPYIVYFTKVNFTNWNRCNNIFRAIKNQHTDYSKTDLQKGVILMEFTNYEVANGVIEHVKELRQLGWMAFIPTLKISRTVIIHNVDPSLPIQNVFDALQSSNNSKILNIERLKKPVEVDSKTENKPTNMIKVTFKDPIVPDKLLINNQTCYVKRYIPRTLVCDYCEKYEHVNEGCKAFWEKMWKSHCKSNFSVEFECAICEGGKKLYQDPGYLSWLEGVEVDAIKRSLSISKKDAKDIRQDFAEIETVIRSQSQPSTDYDLSNTLNEIVTAVEHWDVNYIQDLHLNGMKFNEKLNSLNQTALHLAISNKAPLSLIKLLISVGADVNSEDVFCQSPLFLAITDGDEKILDSFVNVHYSQTLEISMDFKITEERRALIKLLLESGAVVNPVKPTGSVADKDLHDDVKNDANETRQLEGYTPITLLHLVAFIGDDQVLELLLNSGADVNSWHTLFGSPIYMAVFLGHEKIVHRLLCHGADVLRPLGPDATVDPSNNLENMSLLHVALSARRENLVKILLEHMFETPPTSLEGQNIIQSFIKYPTVNFNMSKEFRKEVEFKDLYMNYGPPNTTKTGTPAYKPQKDYSITDYVMCMFLKNGIDINYKNKDGVSALEIAAEKGLDNPYVRLLLNFGADINARNCNGGTALHVALRSKSLPKKDSWDFPGILKYSPDFCIKDNNGRTPLSYVNDQIYQIFISTVKNRRADILKALNNVRDVANSFKGERQDFHSIKAEIRLLKETPVTWKPYCSLYKFLKLPRDKLKSVLRNEHLVYEYRKIDQTKFKYFYPLLREKFREAEAVNELESRFSKSINLLLQSDFPDFLGDEIFKYLTLDEIRCVITASALPRV